MPKYERNTKTERNDQMKKMAGQGYSLGSVSALFGISRQRVQQITSGYQQLIKKSNHFKELSNIVKERQEQSCLKCGSISHNLLIHHIDGDDSNNELTNLVALCSKCHLDLHRPKSKNGCSSNTKTERNKAIVEMVRNRPDFSLREIGKMFKVSAQRVWLINKRWKEK